MRDERRVFMVQDDGLNTSSSQAQDGARINDQRVPVPIEQAGAVVASSSQENAQGASTNQTQQDQEEEEIVVPDTEELRKELFRVHSGIKFRRAVRNTLLAIVSVAAVSVLISMLFMPVLRIYGSSMTPTFYEDDVVVCIRTNDLQRGDIVAFYYNNKVLVKRVIAGPGSWVNIEEDGTVYVNNQKVDEPYILDKALGECDIKMPYQVPDNRYFVMGDHRSTSIDSRFSTIGCISTEQVIGKVFAVIWPLDKFGLVG